MATTTTNRRCLITGGAGFVGFHLTQNLLSDDATEVTLVDNFVRGRRDEDFDCLRSSSRVRIITGDICDPAFYQQLEGRSFDEVYHLAAIIGVKNVLERPHDVIRVNGMGTLALLDWFVQSNSGKLLFSSTSEAYAWTKGICDLPIPTPEDVPLALTDLKNPRASYAGSKIFGELAVNQYCQQYDKPFTIVRYHNVYGPHGTWDGGREKAPAAICRKVAQASLSGGSEIEIWGDGTRTRSFMYIDDCIKGTQMLTASDITEPLNIGSSELVSINQLVDIVEDIAGVQLQRKYLLDAPGGVNGRNSDNTLILAQLGWEPSTKLRDGLNITYDWVKEQIASGTASL